MRRMHRGMAVAFSLLLSLSGAARIFAETGNVSLRSEENFLAFAKSCYTQEYSEGKTFSLQNDLDLTGAAFAPIPLFCGTFEGNGHEIRGISVDGSGSYVGLFRYVEEDAVIRDLRVSGTVLTNEDSEYIGGIAGGNRGRIQGCEFDGVVAGASFVGGIAGHNEETGEILECQNSGMISGNKMAGGIVGYQEGFVEASVNQGDINTDPEHMPSSSENEAYLSLDKEQLRVNFSEEKVQDVGGIAGMSEGVITDCRNLGNVGYERMGDYVGGIVGRQNGQIRACENQGRVTGRRYIGGIAGQLEPYLRFFYEEDTLDQLEKHMDELSEITDAFSDTLDDTTDQTSDHLDEVDRLLKEIRDITKEHKNDQKEKRDAFRDESTDHLDNIQEVLDDLELNIGSRDAKNAMSRISKNVTRAKGLLKELGGVSSLQEFDTSLAAGLGGQLQTPSNWEELNLYSQLGQDFWIENEDWILEDMDEITEATTEELLHHYGIAKELAACAGKILEDAEIVIFNGSADVEDDIQDLMDDLDSLRCESSDLISLVRDYMDQLMDDLDILDDDLSARLDTIADEGDDISDILKDGKDSLKSEKERLDDLLDRIDQVFKDGKSRVRDRADQILDEEDFFTDISDDTWQEVTNGMILECRNSGRIMGESESGGIAGSMGIKVLEDLKDRISTDGNRSLNVFKETKAVILDCKNDGEIRARYDYAGGIAGNMNLGLVRSCENYGNVMSENGDYAGGIAGKSDHSIRGSYSMCSVNGGTYVGGIAGLAMDLYDNVAMTIIDADASDRFGVIAGYADGDGVISGNIYVDEGIGAINGITYTAQARGVSYAELLEIPELPSGFYQMSVSFFCDEELLESVFCNYGADLADLQFPVIPERDGYYSSWETFGRQYVTNNLQIHAVYEPFTTVIDSGEEPLAMMLAEGSFHPGTKILVEPDASGHGIRGKCFRYEIRNSDGTLYEGDVVLRLLADAYPDNVCVGVLTNDGNMSELQSRRDGKYLVFGGAGSGTVVVMKTVPVVKILAVLAGVMLVAGVIWVKKVRKEKV